MEPNEAAERPETLANRDGKPWALESVVHEINNALVPARHNVERARFTEGSDLTNRCLSALTGIQRILDMAGAITKQLEEARPIAGKLYKEPQRSLAAQALERGEAMPMPGLTAGHLRAQGYVIDLEDAIDAAVLTVDANSPTGFVWKLSTTPPEFALAV